MPLIRKDSVPSIAAAAAAGEARARLVSGSPGQRRAAARLLGETADEIAALSDALTGETDPHVRAAIFTSLVRHAGRESVAAVLPHLRSDDSNLRTGALDALRAMAQVVEPQLGVLLADADPDVRLLACEILRGSASILATTLLIALLERETEANVCASAVDVLAEVGDADALPALARCADRFAHEPFLVFSVKLASDRIRSEVSKGARTGG